MAITPGISASTGKAVTTALINPTQIYEKKFLQLNARSAFRSSVLFLLWPSTALTRLIYIQIVITGTAINDTKVPKITPDQERISPPDSRIAAKVGSSPSGASNILTIIRIGIIRAHSEIT